MRRKSLAEPEPRLPIKLDSTTNGEYAPRPLPPRTAHALQAAERQSAEHARALGISRRAFLESSCGAASVLLSLNQVYGCGAGGRYRVPDEAVADSGAAASAVEGDEFILDVQTHHVAVDREWWRGPRPTLAGFLRRTPQARCGASPELACYDQDHFIKEVFLDSDTDIAVLSMLWGTPEMNPIHIEEAARTRERLAEMEEAPRLLVHGHVDAKAATPEQNAEQMHALVEQFRIDAWKLYPVWSPDGLGYRLDDERTGARVIAQGLELGLPIFAVHKGLRLPGMPDASIDALDVGPAARRFPDAKLLIYHAGYDSTRKEGPYDPRATTGVDTLIRSAREHDIGEHGNVYAELGSVWREVMKDPEQAAHVIGKLLLQFGEDRILWGTDAIWYGSPQDQIMAFRAFEITPEYQERFGYPALTKQAKAKIFGLNAAVVYGLDPSEIRKAQRWDKVARARDEYRNEPRPSHATYGPRTRRELLELARWESAMLARR